MENKTIETLLRKNIIAHIDYHFGRFINGLNDTQSEELSLAAALTSYMTRSGHICFDLYGGQLDGFFEKSIGNDFDFYPSASQWKQVLETASVVGKPGEDKPLILDSLNAKLYLHRYWDYQNYAFLSIEARSENAQVHIDTQNVKGHISSIFPSDNDAAIDWQKIAAIMALTHKLCIISGGPGTGKTYTVAKILSLLISFYHPRALNIALAAPTGKAAARLKEAIRHNKQTLPADLNIIAAIPDKASTIHRLLGTIPNSPYFRYNSHNLLPIDVLVVDEVSMVDLPLFSKLLQALKPDAHLILLGDKDQLSSVEPGSVFGDLCRIGKGRLNQFSQNFSNAVFELTKERLPVAKKDSVLLDSRVELKKSHRFSENSGIQDFSRSIQSREPEDLSKVLQKILSHDYGDISWIMGDEISNGAHLKIRIKDFIIKGYGPYLEAIKAGQMNHVFDLFNQFRVLGALHSGPFGITSLNLIIQELLEADHLIKPKEFWYIGRPIMITENNYKLQLFNGDIGIVLPEQGSDSRLRVYFPSDDGDFRGLSPQRIPSHKTVYAMTVHKSQGSEFDNVLIILPNTFYPVLTRELIYTGITRAKKQIALLADQKILTLAAQNPVKRVSGIGDLFK